MLINHLSCAAYDVQILLYDVQILLLKVYIYISQEFITLSKNNHVHLIWFNS